ncbi:MAG: guanitoxin biosynthesis pre-guanitoxin forming N-methyltransferase GntF [bacterium]
MKSKATYATYDSDWSAKGYLAQYYSGLDQLSVDELAILRFIQHFLSQNHNFFPEMLEVGCGPTIHHSLPFEEYVGQICMADYKKSNLEEIQKWVEGSPDAHNWGPFLAQVLTTENGQEPTTKELVSRMDSLKAKIVQFAECNILRFLPLGYAKEFDLVTSFYTVECSTRTKDEWRLAMENLSGLVKSGGWVVLSALRQTDHYMVGDTRFHCAPIDENDMRMTLIDLGFIMSTITIEVNQCPEWAEEGFNSVIIASAQKL